MTKPSRVYVTKHVDITDALCGVSVENGIKIIQETSSKIDGKEIRFAVHGNYSMPRLCIEWRELEPEESYQKRVDNYERARQARKKKYLELKQEFENDDI